MYPLRCVKLVDPSPVSPPPPPPRPYLSVEASEGQGGQALARRGKADMRCDNLFGFRPEGGPLARTRTLHGRSQHDSSGESAGERAHYDGEVSGEADEIRTPPFEVHRPCESFMR